MPFEVVPEDLVAHASHLDGLVDRLNTAVSAAGSAMNPDAYGLLCAFLPPILNPTAEHAAETLKAAVEGVRTSADNVRTAASSYQDSDQSNGQPFARHMGPGPVVAAPSPVLALPRQSIKNVGGGAA
jgi:hypothetical protein